MVYEDSVRDGVVAFVRSGRSVREALERYPGLCRETVYRWLRQEPARRVSVSGLERRASSSPEVRLALVLEVLGGADVADVARRSGYARRTICGWVRAHRERNGGTAMDERGSGCGPGAARDDGGGADACRVAELEAQVADLRMQMDVLREALGLIKKGHGVDLTALTNRERSLLVDALQGRWQVKALCSLVGLARSCYYYHRSRGPARRLEEERRAVLAGKLGAVFEDNRRVYGYRRLHDAMAITGTPVSECLTRRLMREHGIRPRLGRRRRPYSSYRGEISPAVPNLLERDFHAEKPGCRLVSDITQFSIPAGDLYLSPVIDCFDGKVLAHTIGKHPDAALANDMLDRLAERLPAGARPVIHTDRGCHYRWPGWIARMQAHGWTRSMSAKGCSPDNAAAEGFFGRLKNEMFHNRDWDNATLDDLADAIDDWIDWHNTRRIKRSLGSKSPDQHRRHLGLLA